MNYSLIKTDVEQEKKKGVFLLPGKDFSHLWLKKVVQ